MQFKQIGLLLPGEKFFCGSQLAYVCFYHFQDAADRCIAVEFVVLVEGGTNIYPDDAEKLMQFTNSVCDLESCVIRSYIMGKFLLLSKKII